MASEDPDVEVDFLRFIGRRSADAEGEEKSANVLVGAGSLGLRSDASLLAISNRFGALIAGTAGGLRWTWLKALRSHCAPGGGGGEAATFHEVACGGPPLCLRFNADESLLAVLVVGEGGAHTLLVFDLVAMLLQGGVGASKPLLTHSLAAAATDVQLSPTDPSLGLALGADGSVVLLSIAGESVTDTRLELAQAVSSIAWSFDGAHVWCGCADGTLLRCAPSAAAEPATYLSPLDELSEHRLCTVSPVSVRYLLLGFDPPDAFTEPAIRVIDVSVPAGAAQPQQCAVSLFPLGREPGTADVGGSATRRLHVASLPAWRLAVVCSSDSDGVCCVGSRKGGEAQRWQKWTLPDEEGPPSVPMFERGDESGDQWMMGLGFDYGNEEQLVVVAGACFFLFLFSVWL